MPFDSTPSKTVTHPSVEGLIAWLETQPGETEYEYGSNDDCLLFRYMRAVGVSVAAVAGTYYVLERDPSAEIDLGFALEDIAVTSPRTYSAALERARSLVETR